ncbi:MAG: hypothetical protein M3N08_01290 [Pseudomonadota bacterium]|nr:hypothetical protein [Pseudomonadota bacterium]
MRIPSWIFIALILLALPSCGSDSKDKDAAKAEAKVEETPKKKKTLPICPQVAILRDLDDLKDYGSDRPEASQLVTEARMQNITGDCGYRKTGIDIDFDLTFIAAKGPRLGGDHAEFPFFIAIIDPDQTVVEKTKMTAEFKFSDDKRKLADHVEHLHVFIPLTEAQQPAGPNYRVLAGFQLTQDQLDAIRASAPKLPE